MRAFALFALLLTYQISPAQRIPSEVREILTLQDQRSLGGGRLLSYLRSPDANLRYRAAIALANLQDTSTIGAVAPLLEDPEPTVRAAAAFALGQIGSQTPQSSLLARLKDETAAPVLARILEALGKIGDGQALDDVAAYQGPPEVTGDVAISIARFALRGVKDERSIWRCFDLVADDRAEVRWRALYALWRSAPHGLIDIELAKRVDALTKLTDDPDADVRMNLVTLLGKLKSSEALDLLRAAREAEKQLKNWQVEVQIVRSLAAFAPENPDLLGEFPEFLGSANDNVVIATLQALGGLPVGLIPTSDDSTKLKDALLRLASTRNLGAEMTRGEAFVDLAKFFPEEFVARNILADTSLTVRERAKVIEAVSLIPSGRSLAVIVKALDDRSNRIAMTAWDVLRRVLTPLVLSRIRAGDPDWAGASTTLFRKTISALGRGDMAITYLVANTLADTAYFRIFQDSGQSDSLVLALDSAYTRLSAPDDAEAMQNVLAAMGNMSDARFVPTLQKALRNPDRAVAAVAAAALERITNESYASRIPVATEPVYTDYDWDTLESIKPDQVAVLRTNKGTIRLRLLKEDAPFTVLSFVKLVRKKFYDGLTFHRVVPDFVIQGGDPRGDGWGGPGYAIRSEFSMASFTRGAVGIASSGKDTEGCQFFITQVPAPHLDGRYTVFAKVIEGQDVVDRIQIGDTITEIVLE
jgi:cyclophilin family peptidyl-prolyl cis-trans isomerase/HEAT repeat protein